MGQDRLQQGDRGQEVPRRSLAGFGDLCGQPAKAHQPLEELVGPSCAVVEAGRTQNLLQSLPRCRGGVRQRRGGNPVAAGGVCDVADDLAPVGVGAPDVGFAVVSQPPGERLDPWSEFCEYGVRGELEDPELFVFGDDLEGRRQPGFDRVFLEQSAADAVDGAHHADGHLPSGIGAFLAEEFGLDPVDEFCGGLLREGRGQDLAGLRAAVDFARDFAHQAVGLAGAGAGCDHRDVVQCVVHDRSPLRPQSAEKSQKLQGGF
ncbi:hypothetical protein SRABI128_03988 [Microbacterium sp. Bi128]|nr:hypothetical protein SRABI128_03988 [Microbacterium sp. Bi128]